jgi:hypothetical protein
LSSGERSHPHGIDSFVSHSHLKASTVMASGLRTIDLGQTSTAVQRFFVDVGEEPVVVEQEGEVVCIIYPAKHVASQLAGEALRDVRGAWGVPDEVSEQIAKGNR